MQTFIHSIIGICTIYYDITQWLDYDASMNQAAKIMRDEPPKVQEDSPSYPHYAMMPPPMGMNPMIMNPYGAVPGGPHTHPHMMGGSGGQMLLSGAPNPGNSNGDSAGAGGAGDNKSNESPMAPQTVGNWTMAPQHATGYPGQDIMYQTPMSFTYAAFPPPAWGSRPMEVAMSPYDSTAPMVQMGWGASSFYTTAAIPPSHQQHLPQQVMMNGDLSPMPQSYEGDRMMRSQPGSGRLDDDKSGDGGDTPRKGSGKSGAKSKGGKNM